MVFFPFIYRRLLLRNRVFIPKVFHRNKINFRLHFHHLDGIFLHPDGYRHQDKLTDKRKQQNCHPVIPA